MPCGNNATVVPQGTSPAGVPQGQATQEAEPPLTPHNNYPTPYPCHSALLHRAGLLLKVLSFLDILLHPTEVPLIGSSLNTFQYIPNLLSTSKLKEIALSPPPGHR